MADKTEFWKRIYVLYYKIFDRQYYLGGIKRIDEEIKKQSVDYQLSVWGIDKRHLQRDMIYILHRYGVSFEEYFTFKFYDKNHIGRVDQLTSCHVGSASGKYKHCQIGNF